APADVEGEEIDVEDGRGDLEDVLAQGLAALERRLAADGRRATAPGAATIGGDQRVPGDHAHVFHRHAYRGGRDLGQDRLRALPLLGDAGDAGDVARGLEPRRGPILRTDPRTPGAVGGRAGRGQVEEDAESEPLVHAVRAEAIALAAERLVVGEVEESGERFL